MERWGPETYNTSEFTPFFFQLNLVLCHLEHNLCTLPSFFQGRWKGEVDMVGEYSREYMVDRIVYYYYSPAQQWEESPHEQWAAWENLCYKECALLTETITNRILWKCSWNASPSKFADWTELGGYTNVKDFLSQEEWGSVEGGSWVVRRDSEWETERKREK